ncbi:hypothetical protein B566_EDAN010791 [Ephemera danica]|nr:hypothetical protein B566_EDAN010791 [Ephemera danica]
MATQVIQNLMNSFQSKLEPPVRTHLKNVYGCVCMATLAAGVAASLGLLYPSLPFQPGLLTQLGGLGFLVALMATRNNKQNMLMRFGLLMAVAVCIGLNLIPLLGIALEVDPSIVVTALLSTSVVFVSFSMCSLLSERGKWLFLGGPLMSFINLTLMLMLTSLLFGGSSLVFNVNLYVGLLAMCGFVLYDTQLIMEKRRHGDDDFIAHSVDLFIDLIGIFRRLLIILTKREQESKNKRK